MRKLLLAAPLATLVCVYACASSNSHQFPDPIAQGGGGSGSGGSGGAAGGAGAAGTEPDGGLSQDGNGGDPFDPDAACVAALEQADTRRLPVDIIWMVDNSSSMEPAVAEIKDGLNDFASIIGASMLDYRVIMLSLRDRESPVIMSDGSRRFPVCIPPPLAGDDNCADGARFFQSSIDLRSTQPLEQFLGTLGQTAGYSAGEQRGGEPWADHLRPEATKTIVVVTDDNSRLSATQFETFAGGRNPNNSLTLPPGILDPSWGGLFNGYLFSGIYGWDSDTDPSVKCVFEDGTEPSSSGPTYTTLVTRTNGVRARLCEGHAAWGPFFDALAQAVVATSRLSCDLDIPVPSTGTIDYNEVNVRLTDGTTEEILYRVNGAGGCGTQGGWYYDDPTNPTKVVLCQGSCDQAQTLVGPGRDGRIEVLFGCDTIVR